MGRKPKLKTTRAERAAIAKYKKKSLRVDFRVNPDTERDIFEQLKKQDNKQGYLKRLIRQDLQK